MKTDCIFTKYIILDEIGMKLFKTIVNNLKNNKIMKVGSLSLLATAMTRAINLISVPIFSRLLTTAEYGKADVFMTYVNVFMIILGLDIHGAVGKGRLDYEGEDDELLSSGILMTSVAAVIISALINVLYGRLQNFFGLDKWTINIMLIYSYGMFLINFRSSDYNFFYEYKKNMKMTVTIGVLNVLLSVLLIESVFSTNRFTGRILGATIPTIICGICVYIGYIYRGKGAFKAKYNKYLMVYGIPLIPHNLSHLILSGADKIMINSMISSDTSGIYSLSYTLGMIIQVFSEALNQMFTPWLYRKMQQNEKIVITKVQRIYYLLYATVAVLVIGFSPEILKIIGTKEYWAGVTIIPWIVFAMILNFTYTLYVNIEFFYRKTALISAGTIMAAIINIGLNYFFLVRFGYGFAAISTVISYATLLFFHGIIVNSVLKIKLVDNWFVVTMVVVFFLITSVCVAMVNYLLARWCLVIVCSFVLLLILMIEIKNAGGIKAVM